MCDGLLDIFINLSIYSYIYIYIGCRSPFVNVSYAPATSPTSPVTFGYNDKNLFDSSLANTEVKLLANKNITILFSLLYYVCFIINIINTPCGDVFVSFHKMEIMDFWIFGYLLYIIGFLYRLLLNLLYFLMLLLPLPLIP